MSNPLSPASHPNAPDADSGVRALINTRLVPEAFSQLAGNLAGYPFVKVVVDRANGAIHFLNNAAYPFHADYIAEALLGISSAEVDNKIDHYNRTFYFDPERRFYLGILSLHTRDDQRFFALETVEVDTMSLEMLRYFYEFVRGWIDPALPLLVKPANHFQEAMLGSVDAIEIPRILSHELFASSPYVVLNRGSTRGRIRTFANEADYVAHRHTLEWYDIIVMDKVPEDIPRLSGVINAQHTTPLSHINVLASGWQIPNAVQLGIFERIESQGLEGQWVEISAQPEAPELWLKKIERPAEADKPPAWRATKVKIEEPEIIDIPILPLSRLRMSDRSRYGTKAANLGELHRLLAIGSEKATGFYRVRRPPRANLLPYLAKALEVGPDADLDKEAIKFLRGLVHLPQGIAVPFSIQQRVFESSPKIQQAVGKLKMALELNARQVDALCVSLQQMVLAVRIPSEIIDLLDAQIARHLAGVSTFVVRSSSNAEDLENFSAAGIYESINKVSTADRIFESIKQVWSSLLSPRSVRLRQEAGISLDDVYMGVIIQEEIPSQMGGVLITTNPANRADFRNVYFNLSTTS
ncbi:MAG: phosphoenolpyruvate synthase, partial [Proteobacteria bacterium]